MPTPTSARDFSDSDSDADSGPNGVEDGIDATAQPAKPSTSPRRLDEDNLPGTLTHRSSTTAIGSMEAWEEKLQQGNGHSGTPPPASTAAETRDAGSAAADEPVKATVPTYSSREASSARRASVVQLQERKGSIKKLMRMFTRNKDQSTSDEQQAEEVEDGTEDGTEVRPTSPTTEAQEFAQRMAHIPKEDPVGVDEEGRPQFTYRELVRRNSCKELSMLEPAALEENLCDAEFLMHFNMDKEAFRRLPKWRRDDRKKALRLF